MNSGLINEYEIRDAINGKQLDELPPHFKGPITAMFKYHKPGETIMVRKVTNWIHCKTDLEIHMYGIYHNISIKSGFGPAVHQEEFDSFFEFLKTLKISDETLETIKFYHYGDGTTDGTGVKNLSLQQFKEKYKERIKKANDELSNEEIVKAIVYRCVIRGRNPKNQEINFIYYGNKDEGIFVHRSDIYEYANRLDCYYDTAIHFGPLAYCQKIQKDHVRDGKVIQYTQITWPNIKEGLLKIKKMNETIYSSNENIIKQQPPKTVEPKKLNKLKKEDFIIISILFITVIIAIILIIMF